MEKLSVNGKTFDEVFAERGDEIEIKDLFYNTIYFIIAFGHEYVAELSHIDDDDGMLMFNDSICNDGEFDSDNGEKGVFGDYVFIATENQIALLNLYKSQEK